MRSKATSSDLKSLDDRQVIGTKDVKPWSNPDMEWIPFSVTTPVYHLLDKF